MDMWSSGKLKDEKIQTHSLAIDSPENKQFMQIKSLASQSQHSLAIVQSQAGAAAAGGAFRP